MRSVLTKLFGGIPRTCGIPQKRIYSITTQEPLSSGAILDSSSSITKSTLIDSLFSAIILFLRGRFRVNDLLNFGTIYRERES